MTEEKKPSRVYFEGEKIAELLQKTGIPVRLHCRSVVVRRASQQPSSSSAQKDAEQPST